MPKTVNWDKVIDSIQVTMIWMLIMVIFACVLVLILFDVLVGAGVMMYLTNNDWKASLFISMATSGLLISLMMMGYALIDKGKNFKAALGIGTVVLIAAFGVYCLDVYFDSLTADYLRFDTVITISSLSVEQQMLHRLFRILLGGISTIGEGLAVAIILGLPVLKDLIGKALPTSKNIPSNFTNKNHNKDKGKNVYRNRSIPFPIDPDIANVLPKGRSESSGKYYG